MPTIQEVFDACAALAKQRHFAQLLIVPFQFHLVNEAQEQPGDVRLDTQLDLDASGYLTYTSPTIMRMNPSGGGVFVGGRDIVVSPGKLVASVRGEYSTSTPQGGFGPTPIEVGIAIYTPLSVGTPLVSAIDISYRIPGGHTLSTEVEADPNAPSPIKAVGLDRSDPPGATIPAKNTISLSIGLPSLFWVLPTGPVQGLHR